LVRLGGRTPAAVATYGGNPRNPVLLDRATWPAVSELAVGDVGARAWLRAHRDLGLAVPCDGTGRPEDIDTADDLRNALRGVS
jgi:CTP:molybdopterin cytidylyltransferase MocA